MTNESYIHIRNATLSFPSSVYNALTLKEEVFKILNLGQRTKLLYDVLALKDVTIEIHEGEKVGIIGRNGAGKSTMLKAMAGIYSLQSGSIETSGRIRSLFELSLGFEPEATGRENITYRSLLMGETPRGVREKEDAIIDIAGLGGFIDYPLKTYSAGMMVRLAFAISTSIAGDILLLDEILSAGDIAFQVKARARMMELIDQAKIIVLVSHDMDSIRALCNRAIFLQEGKVIADGKVDDVIQVYLETINQPVPEPEIPSPTV
jgi:lipopolysaccharide transport system ATP-binding protein